MTTPPATLRCLDLAYNYDIGDAGATSLAVALTSNKSLRRLEVGQCRIGDAGGTALANALKTNEDLEELDIQGNNIGVAGAKALASALKVNGSLRSLWVWSNDWGAEGRAALLAALARNTGLTDVRTYPKPRWLVERLKANAEAHAVRRLVLAEWGDGRDRLIASLPPRPGNIYRRVLAQLPRQAIAEVLLLMLQAPTEVEDDDGEEEVESDDGEF